MAWYYLDTEANATGPVTSSFILEKYHWKNGEITRGTHVWHKDLVAEWSELATNYTILVNDAINNIQHGQPSQKLLQFIMNPYTIYIHTSHQHSNKKPMGQAQVEIEYKGYLATHRNPNNNNGSVINPPFIQNREIIALGQKKNAYGLELALYNMSQGDQANVYIPWRLAYGEKGAGNLIPPKCDVLFDLKMHNITQQGAKWTSVSFEKWRKMKQKWNTQKQEDNTLFIQSVFEDIPYQQKGYVGGGLPSPKAGKSVSAEDADINGDGETVKEWLMKQNNLPSGFREKLAELGINSWFVFCLCLMYILFIALSLFLSVCIPYIVTKC